MKDQVGKKNHSYRHGGFGTGTYRSWSAMLQRCRNETHPSWKEYGGRGIDFDPRWVDFVNFREDMGERPEGCTIDRIDSNRGYWKDNCRWATSDVQANNKRNKRTLTVNGKTRTLTEWAAVTGLAKSTIHARLRFGWSDEDAVTKQGYRKEAPRNETN